VQRAAQRCSLNKSDGCGRVIMSGEIVFPGDRRQVQQRVQDFYASPAPALSTRYETQGDFHGYTNRSFPVLAGGPENDSEIYVLNYYDDYSSLAGFPAAARFQFQPELGADAPLDKAVGRQTAEK